MLTIRGGYNHCALGTSLECLSSVTVHLFAVGASCDLSKKFDCVDFSVLTKQLACSSVVEGTGHYRSMSYKNDPVSRGWPHRLLFSKWISQRSLGHTSENYLGSSPFSKNISARTTLYLYQWINEALNVYKHKINVLVKNPNSQKFIFTELGVLIKHALDTV